MYNSSGILGCMCLAHVAYMHKCVYVIMFAEQKQHKKLNFNGKEAHYRLSFFES
jgi:hypothetical protein